MSWGRLGLGVRDRIGNLLTSIISMPGGLRGAVGDLSVLYKWMLESVVDLHSIFKLSLVQALNCTYGIHPDLGEVLNLRSRCRRSQYPKISSLMHRKTFQDAHDEKPAEQAT